MFEKIIKKIGWKKWTYIEDCPQKDNFYVVIKNERKIKIVKVYVHTDNNFLMWRDIRTLDGRSIGKWKVIYYKLIKNVKT